MHYKCLVITEHGTQKEVDELMFPHMETGVINDSRVEFVPRYSNKIAHALMKIHNKKMYKRMKQLLREKNIVDHEFYKRNIYGNEKEFMENWHGYDLVDGYWGSYENIDAFWDWYSIGGSWNRELKATKGRKVKGNHRSQENKEGFDIAKLKNITNLNELTSWRILGEEFNIAKEKWDTFEEKFIKNENYDDNTTNFLKTLQEIRPEYYITIVDYHC